MPRPQRRDTGKGESLREALADQGVAAALLTCRPVEIDWALRPSLCRAAGNLIALRLRALAAERAGVTSELAPDDAMAAGRVPAWGERFALKGKTEGQEVIILANC